MARKMIDELYPSMPWEKIDAVVFDVGNVLLSFRPEKILHDLLPDCPELYPELLRVIFRSPYWAMMDHGVADLEEAAGLMAGSAPELTEQINTVMTHWVEMKDVVQEGLDALKCCKAHGKKLYVMSNYGNTAFEYVRRKYDFFQLFDGLVISSHEKLIKPDPAIYHLLTGRYGLAPDRTLFIDDAPANIESALFCGWQGLCFNAPGRLSRFIKDE